jgi:hypothetical protein
MQIVYARQEFHRLYGRWNHVYRPGSGIPRVVCAPESFPRSQWLVHNPGNLRWTVKTLPSGRHKLI